MFFIFIFVYGILRLIGLSYESAEPTALIGVNNHFEVAITVSIMFLGLNSDTVSNSS